MKFRIRSLFVLMTCVAIQSLRPAHAVIVVKYSQVRAILPTVEQYSASFSGTYEIKRDDTTNTIIVTSSARSCDANAKAISDFIIKLESNRAATKVDSPSPSAFPFWTTASWNSRVAGAHNLDFEVPLKDTANNTMDQSPQ